MEFQAFLCEMNLAPSDFIGEIVFVPIVDRQAVGLISKEWILFSVKLKFNKKFIAVVKSEINF